MASGLSDHNKSGSKGFDFAWDDILCSYEDYGNQDDSNGSHSDSAIRTNSTKGFHKSRMTRSSMFPAPANGPREESFNQELVTTVEKTVKKHSDNLMGFLEGLSSRLSQLELYYYNLDKSIGEMRSDLVHDHGEQDSKLKSLEKHLQEVHRSVQIIRDKQKLAETQKELAKLQLAQKESSTNHSQQNEERAALPASESKKPDSTPDVQGQQLALALPHQVAPPPSIASRPLEQQLPIAPPPPPPSHTVTQTLTYYLPAAPIQNPPAPHLPPQGQYMPSESQYRARQMQDMSRVAPQPVQTQVNQAPQIQSIPKYQQQWQQQMLPPCQPSVQSQVRPPSAAVYPPYLPSQPANPSPPEALQSSMAMQVPHSGISQPAASRADAMPCGFGGPGSTVQPQPPPQQLKPNLGVRPSDSYTTHRPHPSISPRNTYMMYEGEGAQACRPPYPTHLSQGGYPPTSIPIQNLQPNPMGQPTQFVHNNPYGELIGKMMAMGYSGDQVASVIQRLEETGQPNDFNAVLDGLNGSSGRSQRGWSA